MQRAPKTVSKLPPSQNSLHLQNLQSTYVQSKVPKSRSLTLPNQIFFFKENRQFKFPLFHDNDIGIDSQNGAYIIDLGVDQDCQSSKSVVEYGIKLCQNDLKQGIDERKQEQESQNCNEY